MKDNKDFTKAKVGKREMHAKFHEMYPSKHLKELDIITSLKTKGIEYDKGVRSEEGVRGCFIGVRFKNADEIEDKEELHNSVGSHIKSDDLLKKALSYLGNILEIFGTDT